MKTDSRIKADVDSRYDFVTPVGGLSWHCGA